MYWKYLLVQNFGGFGTEIETETVFEISEWDRIKSKDKDKDISLKNRYMGKDVSIAIIS